MARLNGEGLEESNADADHAHGHAATDEQQEAHTEAQADLCHNESAVGGVEAIDGVVPAHCWERGQDEGHHPDTHHCVNRLLFGVTQPGSISKEFCFNSAKLSGLQLKLAVALCSAPQVLQLISLKLVSLVFSEKSQRYSC